MTIVEHLRRLSYTSRTLRCVLFHDVSDQLTPFTAGLGVTTGTRVFEQYLAYFSKTYSFISLTDLLEETALLSAEKPPLLVTFDDSYSSVATTAVPLCTQFGISPVVFVNSRYLDNRDVALDNLVCYAVNTYGVERVLQVLRRHLGATVTAKTIREFLTSAVPCLTGDERWAFEEDLSATVGINRRTAANEARLYMTTAQLIELHQSGCEVANHTYSHVHCRILQNDSFSQEIDYNAGLIRDITGIRPRAFSIPYGSRNDLTPGLTKHLIESHYQAIFLAEGTNNIHPPQLLRVQRVSIRGDVYKSPFKQIEVLPRLRSLRNRLRTGTRCRRLF